MENRLINGSATKAMLIFFGSYFFSVCLTVLIHETGHALAFLVLGYPDINLIATPFYGGTSSSESINMNDAAFISAAGPIFDLFCASIITVSLWQKRNIKLLPILMYGGTAFLLEGIVMFNTFFTPTILTDWDVLIFLEFSPLLVAVLTGIVLIIASLFMYILWPLINISAQDSFFKKLYINLGYLIYLLFSILFLMLYNILSIPEIMFLIVLNLTVAIIFLILRILAYKPLFSLIDRITHTEVNDMKKDSIWLPLVLASTVFLLLTFFLN